MATEDTGGAEEQDRFPFPDEVEMPDEMEGWEEMYPDYFIFDRTEERSEYERQYLWFRDKTHYGDPLVPWDNFMNAEGWQMAISQGPSRAIALPPAMAVEFRVHGGYMFATPIPTGDPELVEERGPIFAERSSYVFDNYEALGDHVWKPAVREIGNEIRELEVPEELPRYVPDDEFFQAKGMSQDTLTILENYNRLCDLTVRAWQRHFEYIHLAYLGYMAFQETCQELFPGIADDTIGKMVSALKPDLFQPDEELNKLAELAIELGDDVVSVIESDASADEKMARLEETEAGQEFMEAFNEAKDPWFHLSYGDGLHSADGSWIDDLEAPFEHLQTKVRRAEEGEDLGRDYDKLLEEREELVDEYRSYLDSEEERAQFNQAYEDCISIYEYAEDHQFWIEHWTGTTIWNKMREFGRLAVNEGVLDDPEDIFMFSRFEVAELLEEVCETWALGPNGFEPTYWKKKADERKEILEAAREWEAPSFLGEPPEEILDPTVRMLWGVTTERVYNELDREEKGEVDTLTGFASSTGVVEGKARILESADELGELEDGEILVSSYTNPAWAPVFPRISGAVTNDGGITSHAAIVCREYGVPAVTGTGDATTQIKTGDLIRVDGEEGTVEILERA